MTAIVVAAADALAAIRGQVRIATCKVAPTDVSMLVEADVPATMGGTHEWVGLAQRNPTG